jgi:hypothetical protein
VLKTYSFLEAPPSLWYELYSARHVNVFNMGESGYDSRQSLESLINLLSKGQKVDLAVFYLGVNEINRCRNVIGTNSHALEKQYRDKKLMRRFHT